MPYIVIATWVAKEGEEDASRELLRDNADANAEPGCREFTVYSRKGPAADVRAVRGLRRRGSVPGASRVGAFQALRASTTPWPTVGSSSASPSSTSRSTRRGRRRRRADAARPERSVGPGQGPAAALDHRGRASARIARDRDARCSPAGHEPGTCARGAPRPRDARSRRDASLSRRACPPAGRGGADRGDGGPRRARGDRCAPGRARDRRRNARRTCAR